MKKSISCGECGGEAILGERTIPWPIGKNLLLIHHVPCYKCSQCGNIELNSSVVGRLEILLKKYKKLQVNTEVEYKIA